MVSAKTHVRASRAYVPRVGRLSGWNASPPGRSMRSAQVFPLPPGRLDVKSSSAPSGENRGFELSVLGDVYRTGSPPAVGATHTSLWRRFSFSFTVVTVKATSRPSG